MHLHNTICTDKNSKSAEYFDFLSVKFEFVQNKQIESLSVCFAQIKIRKPVDFEFI